MLEQKIESLTSTIEKLIGVLERQGISLEIVNPPQHGELVTLVGHEIESEEKVPFPPAEDPAQEAPKALSHEDLQDLCLSIVRGKKATKAQIKDIVAEFGGASLVKEVPTADLPALKNKLEALK
jgi:hypothetical protein